MGAKGHMAPNSPQRSMFGDKRIKCKKLGVNIEITRIGETWQGDQRLVVLEREKLGNQALKDSRE